MDQSIRPPYSGRKKDAASVMSVITSKDSRTFKELQRLTQKKYRDREGVFIAEGPNIVGEALSTDDIEVVRVFAREGSGYESFQDDVTVLSADLFDRVSDTMTSQGVLAVIRKPGRGSLSEVLRHSSAAIKTQSARHAAAAGGGTGSAATDEARAEGRGDVVVLDRLQDPGNIGTIIRTAEGAGISAVIIIKGTCDPFSPKVVRACAGSILRMPIAFAGSAEELIDIAHDTGYKLAVTDVESGVPYYDAGLSRRAPKEDVPEDDREADSEGRLPIALVIGNEGNGVSEALRSAADILVNIPMRGKLESLNASVAAALLMYEMSRP